VDGFQLRGKFLDALAAVSLDDADDDVFTAAFAADGLAQHAVGLANAGSIAQEKFENPRALDEGEATSSHSSGFLGKLECAPVFEIVPGYNKSMARFISGRGIGFAVAAILLISITFGYTRFLHVNQTTVALSFLLAILAVSAVWGMWWRFSCP